MRAVILPLLIFMLTAGIAIAENKDKAQKPEEGFKKERVVKMRGGKYSRMFVSLLHKTRALNLNEEQKDEVNKIGKEYASTIINQENESRFSQKEFMKQLQAGVFEPEQLRTLSKDAEVANLKAADSFIDGLSALKSTIGPENFAKLIPLTKVNRNALVKLKEEKSKIQMESKEPEAEATTK
jgi:hypothetical protein